MPRTPSLIRRVVRRLAPWIITSTALYLAFRGVDWGLLFDHLWEGDPAWIALAVGLTSCSYLMRARRWQFLFPTRVLAYSDAARVLILGFFMNNVLPARTGELVRAHLGSRVTGLTRTLVLATIASERLVDGLMLSVIFCIVAPGLSKNLLYVAGLFAAAAAAVLLVLALRGPLSRLADRLSEKVNHPSSRYAANRFKVFLEGLAPLTKPRTAVTTGLWSAGIWLVEMWVFIAVSRAFNAPLGLAGCVLFMTAVNFSSLVPLAPGGIGVIEAFTSVALVSIGVPREQALTLVIVQHVTQYLVVGIPGTLLLLMRRPSELPFTTPVADEFARNA